MNPRTLITVSLLTLAMVPILAAPAWADPAKPGNYRSTVTDLDPAPAGLAVEVVGGDSFLVVTVSEGHLLEVPGYFGEPYLRIDESGTVWRNELSPARWINTDRYGTSIPEQADATAEPDWQRVGAGGTYAWHDHRTHWMSADLPPAVAGDRAEVVFPWEFPVVFDGATVSVHGELVWFPSTNPAGPILIGVVGLAPLGLWRPGREVVLSWLLALIGSLALGSNRIRATAARIIAALALVFWAVGTIGVLAAPVLPSSLPAPLERTLVAMTLLAAAGATAIVVLEAARKEAHD